MLRTCYTCKQQKLIAEFVKRSDAPEGHGYQCTECNRAAMRQWRKDQPEKHRAGVKRWRKKNPAKVAQYARTWRERYPEKELIRRLKDNYALSKEQYEALLTEQKGKCAICRKPPKKFLHVDHNHATGKVRQLLCPSCNTGIGLFNEDPVLLQAVITYLRKHLTEGR